MNQWILGPSDLKENLKHGDHVKKKKKKLLYEHD